MINLNVVDGGDKAYFTQIDEAVSDMSKEVKYRCYNCGQSRILNQITIRTNNEMVCKKPCKTKDIIYNEKKKQYIEITERKIMVYGQRIEQLEEDIVLDKRYLKQWRITLKKLKADDKELSKTIY